MGKLGITEEKKRLLIMTPLNYIGKAIELARNTKD